MLASPMISTVVEVFAGLPPSLAVHWIAYAWPSPSPASAGMLNVAVAPFGDPAGVIVGLTRVDLSFPTTDQTIPLMPVKLCTASVTTLPGATATASVGREPLTVNA